MNGLWLPADDELLDALLIKTSRTFALSIPVLPESCRREVTLAYLLFRVADTLEDATSWTRAQQLEALHDFARVLRQPKGDAAERLAARWSDQPPLDNEAYLELLQHTPEVVGAFLQLEPQARDVVRSHVLRTIDRMAGFVARAPEADALQLNDLDELRAYCYAVAGIVGEMLTELFLLRYARLAPAAEGLRARSSRFGEALQLVNILKDAQSDEREGRNFLPPRVARSAVFSLARAGLVEATEYVAALVRSGAPRGLIAFAALPVRLAFSTLDRVEREGPGSKLTRPEVMGIVASVEDALDRDPAAVVRHVPIGPDG